MTLRIRLTYADQNESFNREFPAAGIEGFSVRRMALKDWGNNWHLIQLDRPFEYKATTFDQVLIRSRWEGHEIGEDDNTSVFILLARDSTVLDKPLAEAQDFEQAAWGMSETITKTP